MSINLFIDYIVDMLPAMVKVQLSNPFALYTVTDICRQIKTSLWMCAEMSTETFTELQISDSILVSCDLRLWKLFGLGS